jgi:ribonuclease BN (tRNA processing enzyme)
LRYGGNTSCVSIAAPGEAPLVLDMGTGLRYFGKQMPADELFRGYCLLTHLHWDHVQGLPFFTPLLKQGSSLDVYGPAQADGRTLNDVVSFTIRPPLFPVSVDELPGDVFFHDTADAEFNVGGFRVMSRLIPHLGPTLGFRVELNGKSVAYMSDHQQPFDGSMSIADGPLELAAGVDLLIHDSQYTPHEFEAKSTWGHCTTEYAVWLACKSGVKQLALFHHDPSRRDDDLDEILACAAETAASHGVDVIAASEGLVIDLI